MFFEIWCKRQSSQEYVCGHLKALWLFLLTSLARRAAANERSHAVDASGAGGAGLSCTVINVFRAVRAAPAVHTYTVVAVACVTARASILTGVGLQSAFIHVIGAKLTWKRKGINFKRKF